jgi:formylglycine-generating enzyme required for sulfatase activity
VACLILVLGVGALGLLRLRTKKTPEVTADPVLPKEPEVKVELGKEIRSDIGMRLVRIPGGRFKMGSPPDEKEREPHGKGSEEQHEVEVSAFYLGEKEVTQKEFRAVMGYNPSYFSNNARGKEGVTYVSEPGGGREKVKDKDTESFPVENVSWDEAMEFCRQLTTRDQGKQLPSGHVCRLPREAEWEYACRGGVSSYQAFHFGNSLSSNQANFHGNYPYGGADKGVYLQRTCLVGSYKANAFGLHDMHGNVAEWCHDWYAPDYYSKSLRQDPPGPAEGPGRVVRGGDWNGYGQICRSASRSQRYPAFRDRFLGFRVALVPYERK